MFKPKYTITNKLVKNIKEINSLITDLNNKRLPKIVFMEMVKEARAVSAHTSTSIEGNPLPLTDVKKILKSFPKNIRDSEMEVVNYNRALEKLNKDIKSKKFRFSEKIVFDVHKEVVKGLLNKSQTGRYRAGVVFVNNPRSGGVIYLPPSAKRVKLLMKDLVEFITKNRNEIDPVILAGIFHKQFVIIHPFMDGNGRTCRLITKVILADLGLDTFELFSFENFYNKNVTKYFEKVGELGNYYEIAEMIDFSGWLEYFSDGIIDEILRVRGEIKKISACPERELKKHHRKIIGYIEKNGYITDRSYSKLTDRAKATRNLDFRKLMKMGVLTRKGKGKNTFYVLKETI